MIKRWDTYRGCNTTIEAIARECSDGGWIRWSDIKKLFGVYDEDDMNKAQQEIKEAETSTPGKKQGDVISHAIECPHCRGKIGGSNRKHIRKP